MFQLILGFERAANLISVFMCAYDFCDQIIIKPNKNRKCVTFGGQHETVSELAMQRQEQHAQE